MKSFKNSNTLDIYILLAQDLQHFVANGIVGWLQKYAGSNPLFCINMSIEAQVYTCVKVTMPEKSVGVI